MRKYKWLLILIIGAVIFGTIIFLLFPRVKLSNKEVNYGMENKPNVSIYNIVSNLSKYSKVTNNVDTNRLGNYNVNVKFKYLFISFNRNYDVEVVDKVEPGINIEGSEIGIACPGKEYVEEGYIASDDYDGDITDKVKVYSNNNTIVFTVTDSSNNTNYVIKNIIKEDVTKPSIRLINSSSITLQKGEKYQEYGVEVEDDCDKSISNKVIINSNVDTSKEGNYTVNYYVYDENLNKNKVQRDVKVIDKPQPGTIFLTFDDGPNEETTPKILDILKEEGVQATFFVTSFGPDKLIKREFDEGHTVALHTASHNYGYIYSSEENYFKDLEKVQNRVYKITGYKSMIIRFPGGSSNTISARYKHGIMSNLTKQVHKKGYKYYDWNAMNGDAEPGNHNSKEMYNNFMNSISKDKVNYVLLHDIKPYTRDSLKKIIRECKKRGYTFSKITESTPELHHGVNN